MKIALMQHHQTSTLKTNLITLRLSHMNSTLNDSFKNTSKKMFGNKTSKPLKIPREWKCPEIAGCERIWENSMIINEKM